MIETDQTFETTTLTCDECGEEHEADTTDWSTAVASAREYGWTVKYQSGDYSHYCGDCSEGN